MTDKRLKRLNNRIQDLHATIHVTARAYAEARANGMLTEAESASVNIEILQGLLEAAYAKLDSMM
jgi:hypothetical protein